MKNAIGLALLGLALIIAAPASAATATFNFLACANSTTGSPAPSCTSNGDVSSVYGDTLTFNSNVSGVSVQVSAVGSSTSAGNANTLSSAAINEFVNNGLGVCSTGDAGGAGCANPDHQVDNSGGYEFVLFKFTTPVGTAVTLGSGSSIKLLDYQGTDMDMSYWTRTVTGAPTLSALGDLTSFGSAQTNASCSSNCGSGNTITDSNLTSFGSNITYLLVGAQYVSGTTSNAGDTFKIQNLVVNTVSTATPEPATFGLIGLSLAGLGFLHRKRKAA